MRICKCVCTSNIQITKMKWIHFWSTNFSIAIVYLTKQKRNDIDCYGSWNNSQIILNKIQFWFLIKFTRLDWINVKKREIDLISRETLNRFKCHIMHAKDFRNTRVALKIKMYTALLNVCSVEVNVICVWVPVWHTYQYNWVSFSFAALLRWNCYVDVCVCVFSFVFFVMLWCIQISLSKTHNRKWNAIHHSSERARYTGVRQSNDLASDFTRCDLSKCGCKM